MHSPVSMRRLMLLGVVLAALVAVHAQEEEADVDYDFEDYESAKINRDITEDPFLFATGSEPIGVPLDINVALIGFEGDGGFEYNLDPDMFKFSLTESLPSYQPSCVETGKKLDIAYDFKYNLVKVPHPALANVEEALLRAMKAVPNQYKGKSLKVKFTFEVEVTDVLEVFDQIYDEHFRPDAEDTNLRASTPRVPYTLFILNPDKRRLIPREIPLVPPASPDEEPEFAYHYKFMDGGRTQAWVAHKRYAVVDLSAGPCQYGGSNAGEGTISYDTVPRLRNLFAEAQDSGSEHTMVRNVEFLSQLSSIVVSAVRFLWAPDIRYDAVQYSEKIVVPIVVLRNHREFNPLVQGEDYSIDTQVIENEVRKMLGSDQELLFTTRVHMLHDHRQISLAVSKSMRSDTVHEATEGGTYVARIKQYIDSGVLYREMKEAGDALAGGLIGAAQGDSGELLQSHGSRILPVYVFSLAGIEGSELLFDGKDVVSAQHDAVMVIQTDGQYATMPYFSESDQMFTSPRRVNRHILAGIATALGGLLAPTERYSRPAKRIVEDYMWANGYHPFGPFSNCAYISATHIDTIQRNSVISRINSAIRILRESIDSIEVFAKQYVFNPFGEEIDGTRASSWLTYDTKHSPVAASTVNRLHSELLRIEEQFVAAADHMYSFELEEANSIGSTVLLTARALKTYIEEELEAARKEMFCCSMQHEVDDSSSTIMMVSMLAGSGLVVYALVMWMSSSNKRTGAKRRF